MAETVMPLSTCLVDLTLAFTDQPIPPQVLQIMNQLDQSNLVLSALYLEDVQEGRLARLTLPPLPGGELVFHLTGVPFVSAVLKPGSSGDFSIDIIQPAADPAYLEVRNLLPVLRLSSPLLRPVDGNPYVEMRASGGVRLYRNWHLRLSGDAGLSLDECEIGATGLRVRLDGVAFDFSDSDSIAGIKSLGFDASFQGVYARSGRLTFLPQFRSNGSSGVSIAFRDAAIGNTGVSLRLRAYHAVVQSSGQIDTGSGLHGYLLDPAWAVALGAIEIDLRENDVERFFVEGLLRVPLFNVTLAVTFGLLHGPGGSFRQTASMRSANPFSLSLGLASLSLQQIFGDAILEASGFQFQGQVTGSAQVPGFLVEFNQSMFRLAHSSEGSLFSVQVHNLLVGPFGQVDAAELVVSEELRDGQSSSSVYLLAEFSWQDLRQRLSIPAGFPAPPDEGKVRAKITWVEDTAAGTVKVRMSLSADLVNLDELWAFLPRDLRPEVKQASLELQVEYQSVAAFDSDTSDQVFSGTMSASVTFRIPQLSRLASSDLIKVQAGDEQGYLTAIFQAVLDGSGSGAVSAAILNPVAVAVNLPGLEQDHPPVRLVLDEAAFTLASGAGASSSAEGSLLLRGNFALNPFVPPDTLPISGHIKKLFEPLEVSPLTGSAAVEIKFKNDQAQLKLSCEFTNARVDLDLFDLLSNLTKGLPVPIDQADATRAKAAFDFDAGFGLKKLAFQLGDVESGGDPTPAAAARAELSLEFRFAGLVFDSHIRISDQALAVGITEMQVPLSLPRFPLSLAELDTLTSDQAWQDTMDSLAARITQLEQLLQVSENRQALAELAVKKPKLALLVSAWSIRQRLSSAQARAAYQSNLRPIVEILEAYTGLTHADSQLVLELRDVQFKLPFTDPRDIGLEGSASLIGFAPDDPFKTLEGLTMTLGLSADMIFFSLDSSGDPIPFPDFGRYKNGSISLSKLSIGYGYTKNSLAIALLGEMVLPPQLIEDADTTETLGLGVRLPRNSSLAFRFDIIPIPPPSPIPVFPMFEFNLDLRRPGSPDIASTQMCEPAYDGIELIFPGVIHADFKRLAVSPVYGVMPLPHFVFDGDIVLGDASNGLSLVVDNLTEFLGLASSPLPISIPFLASPTEPYFNHLCVSVRVAGFGVNFNLERPLPSFHPLALFEVAGLLSDPLMPIQPDGFLARTVRMALTDAYIAIPGYARRIFPALSEASRKELNLEINLGTLIAAAQFTIGVFLESMRIVDAAGREFTRGVEDLARHPPDLSPGVLLAALPPEARKLRVAGSFAGFDASAVLLLISPRDAASELLARDRPAFAPAPQPPSLGQQTDPSALADWRPAIPTDGRLRRSQPGSPVGNLFQGIEFEGFSEDDLRDVPLPSQAAAGIVVGAHIKVFAGQRFRFFGFLFENGSFALVSALDLRPLRLRVAGITVSLPLVFSGRMLLAGRQKRDGYYGVIKASAHARWNIIPQVARIELASQRKPASLELYSDGKFLVEGSGRAVLFNGAAVISGSASISDTHCMIEGQFNYEAPGLLKLELMGSALFGPGPGFRLQGQGTLDFLGNRLLDVSGTVTERTAAVRARIKTRRWRINGTDLTCRIEASLVGEIDVRKTSRPRFLLEGRGRVEVFDAGQSAAIMGRVYARGAIQRRNYQVVLGAEGTLEWQGRRWVESHIELGTTGIRLGGRTSFIFNLTPTGVGSVELANLFFKIDLEGDFSFDSHSGLVSLSIQGDWMMAARFGTNQNQILPLAAQAFSYGFNHQLEWTLLEVSGFALLPGFDLDIPVPTLKGTGSALRLGLVNDFPALTYARHGAQLVPPLLMDRNLKKSETILKLTNYTLEMDFNNTQSIELPLSGNFRLVLVWKNNRLGVEVRT